MKMKHEDRRKKRDMMTTAAFVLAFIVMISGLFVPIILVESRQNKLFNYEGKQKPGSIAPMTPAEAGETTLLVEEGVDSYTDIYSRLMLFGLSDDKREREAFSYELNEKKALEYTQLCIKSLLGSYADRYMENVVLEDFVLSSNYLATSSDHEIDAKHKNVDVGGAAVPYDLGRWSLNLSCDDLQIRAVLDSISGRVYSVKLSAGRDFPLSCDNMLVAFAKYHGILDTDMDIKYDSEALKISCGDIELCGEYKKDDERVYMSFDTRLIEG